MLITMTDRGPDSAELQFIIKVKQLTEKLLYNHQTQMLILKILKKN